MRNKKYVHKSEYHLTKEIIDCLEIDMEDNGQLTYDGIPLMIGSKSLTLVGYKEFPTFNRKDQIPFRPFSNERHAMYLISMFSDLKDCEILFEYKDCSDSHKVGKLEGFFKITPEDDKSYKEKFSGTVTLEGLLGALIVRTMCPRKNFKGLVKHIYKIDTKLAERGKSRAS